MVSPLAIFRVVSHRRMVQAAHCDKVEDLMKIIILSWYAVARDMIRSRAGGAARPEERPEKCVSLN